MQEDIHVPKNTEEDDDNWEEDKFKKLLKRQDDTKA